MKCSITCHIYDCHLERRIWSLGPGSPIGSLLNDAIIVKSLIDLPFVSWKVS